MGKIVVIAEKPSVARDIARVLKCNKRSNGFIEGNDYLITWAVGHLATLCEPEDYAEELKKWKLETLPIIPDKMKIKAVKQTKEQFDIISSLINSENTDSLICATDSGREGELIFRYIYELAECKKPFKRLWISSMTDEAINNGFSKLKNGTDYDLLFSSAKCRSEADWLVGINASRAFSIRYDSNLSIGRVQTPTLAIIVNRHHEIESFDVMDYFEVQAIYDGFTGIWFKEGKEGRDTKITSKEDAQKITDKVKGKTAIVKIVEKDEKQVPPPLLYDLTELQRDANKKFGFSAEKTLSIAQDLYEKRKLITYPRTDSRYLSDDMADGIINILKRLSIPSYDKYVQSVLSSLPISLNKRIIDSSKVTDHHAIIPTNSNINLSALSEDEKAVFDIIARRFISVFYPYYVFTITRLILQAEDELFISKGKTVQSLGWMELYSQDEESKDKKRKKKDDEEEQILPDFKVENSREIKDSKLLHKKTKPPSPYTEATLLSAMENAGRFVEDEQLREQLKDGGLGTPATRAGIIERLIAVGYVTRKGKSLIPTDKGLKLIQIVPEELKSPETTGKWEKALNLIYKGSMQSERFMGSIIRYVNYIVEQCKRKKLNIEFPRNTYSGEMKNKLPSFGKCPKCNQGDILENSKSFYCSEWRTNCKFSIWKNSLAKEGIETLSSDFIKQILESGKCEIEGKTVVLDSAQGIKFVENCDYIKSD